MQMQSDYFEQLGVLERGTTSEAALALFDSLPAVPLETMLGSWRGSGLATGHPLDGMLETFGWYGKRFDGPEDVHPLLFATAGGKLFSVNPSLIPMGLVVRFAPLFRLPAIARVLRTLMGVLRTRKPRARLRLTEFRGVATATMIYDALPINDSFRLVDDSTLLGVMDMRGLTKPFVFVLRREGHRIAR
jgi:hypothetical protein